MYQLFVDESYQQDHYYVAGVLVEEKQANELVTRLEDLARNIQIRNNWSTSPEFHGHSLMNGVEDWVSLKGNFGACVRIYQMALHAIQNSGARIYLEGVDVTRLNARYRYPDSPHEIVFRRMLEHIDEYCSRKGEMCKVVADMLPQQEKFNERILGFARAGTLGYRKHNLLCIDGDIDFVDSRKHRGVQAADLSVYILRRHREDAAASRSSRRITARLVKALGPAVVHQRKWLP